MKFSAKLKELRIEKELSQTQLAKRLGITQDSISLWEQGKRMPDTNYVIQLSEIFQVSTDYLLGRTDDFGAVPVLPTAPQLSKNDRELVEAYHTLSPDLQRLLWEQIRLWQRNADAMNAGTKKKA